MIELRKILETNSIAVDNLERLQPLLYHNVLAAMKEACEKAIDLCAEKTEIDFKNIEGDTCLGNIELDPYTGYFVDKESIITVKDLIK